MIKTIKETEYYYKLKEVDDNFTFEDEDGKEIFSERKWNIPVIKVGKRWPIEGIVFGNFQSRRTKKPVTDNRIINQVRDQIKKWSPHDEELAEKVFDSLDTENKFGSLLDLPDETEAYYKKGPEKLVLFHSGEKLIDPNQDILWPANSINVTVQLYWIKGVGEVEKRHWHKQKDKPRFPERKPKWRGRKTFEFDTLKDVKNFGEDVTKTFLNGTYRCVGLQR